MTLSNISFSRTFSPYFFKPQRLKYNVTCFSSTWRYKAFHFPVHFSRTFFKPQRLKYNVTCFSSTWRYKTFHFPVLFPRTFSNRNVWNTMLLAFLVHDVIKHFIFPHFFKLQRLKWKVTCFLVHDVTKHFIFLYFSPVLFKTVTFEIQCYLLL
jgi:hypothetical protein